MMRAVGLLSLLLVGCVSTTPHVAPEPVARVPEPAPLAPAPVVDLQVLISAAREKDDGGAALEAAAHEAETAWRYDLAAPVYESLVAQADNEHDEPALARRLFDLARLHRIVGLYPSARKEAARALSLYEKQFGPNAKELSGVLQVLAFSEVMTTGNFDKAEATARRALALVEKTGTPLELASALNNLAAFVRFTGKTVEAERRYREALRVYEDAGALESAAAATTAHNLAGLLLSRMGPTPEVSALEEQAERSATKALGATHPFTVEVLDALAAIYKQQHRGVRSIEVQERATVARGGKPSWCVNSHGIDGCFAECSPLLACKPGFSCVSLSEVRLPRGAEQSACLPACPEVGTGEDCANGWICSEIHRGALHISGGVCAPP